VRGREVGGNHIGFSQWTVCGGGMGSRGENKTWVQQWPSFREFGLAEVQGDACGRDSKFEKEVRLKVATGTRTCPNKNKQIRWRAIVGGSTKKKRKNR